MVSDTPPSEITALLRRWNKGDREALSNLASAAYPDLCAIARGFLRREGSGHTLQATGLVNELYLRLAQVKGVNLTDRRHFYAFAAQLMRMILIDHARQSRALKRPSSATRVPLHEEMAWIDASSEEMLSLDVALDQLEAIDERKLRVLELRFFLGCTNEETAEVLDISRATVDRDLEFAKAWLYRRLSPTHKMAAAALKPVVDTLGVWAGNVPVADMLADDSAILSLHQGGVLAAAGAAFTVCYQLMSWHPKSATGAFPWPIFSRFFWRSHS